jgi:hypothetical protein
MRLGFDAGVISCPLCGYKGAAAVPTPGRPDYHDCSECDLIFMHPAHLPDSDTESAHYLTHENDPQDPRYRAFLDRLFTPLRTKLAPGDEGLDYGSGPGPTLSVMLEEAGFPTATYDPYFAPDTRVLERSYDFVTCTETVEHFHRPSREFDRLAGMLKPGGWLGIMTEIFPADGDFASWWYRRDPTHVSFFRESTFAWLARRYGWEWERPGRTVVLFRADAAGRGARKLKGRS